MARFLPVALFGAAAAAAIGFLVGRATAPEPPRAETAKAAPARDDAKDREVARLRGRVTELEQLLRAAPRPPEPRAAAPETNAAAEQKLRELLKGDVPPERAARAATLAARIRADSQAAAATADASAARMVVNEMEQEKVARERERRVREDAARGGTMALMRKIHETKTRAADLVASSDDFGAMFARTSATTVVDGPTSRPDQGFADGTIVRFPPGFHTWRLDAFDHKPIFPADLVIEGAGMDATIVRTEDLSTESEVRSLTFRDLTLDCHDSLTDLRREEPATIRFERCRVIGFDSGAGGSVLIYARVAAVFATESRFETGFGRAPGSGNLLRCDTVLARFERCAIAGPMYEPGFSTSDSTTIVFANCRFVDMGERFAKAMESPPQGVRYLSCTTEARDPAAAAAERRGLLASVGVTEEATKTLRNTYSRVFQDPKPQK